MRQSKARQMETKNVINKIWQREGREEGEKNYEQATFNQTDNVKCAIWTMTVRNDARDNAKSCTTKRQLLFIPSVAVLSLSHNAHYFSLRFTRLIDKWHFINILLMILIVITLNLVLGSLKLFFVTAVLLLVCLQCGILAQKTQKSAHAYIIHELASMSCLKIHAYPLVRCKFD